MSQADDVQMDQETTLTGEDESAAPGLRDGPQGWSWVALGARPAQCWSSSARSR